MTPPVVQFRPRPSNDSLDRIVQCIFEEFGGEGIKGLAVVVAYDTGTGFAIDWADDATSRHQDGIVYGLEKLKFRLFQQEEE
jgi:hypothetical protein